LPNASSQDLPLYHEISDAEVLGLPYITGERSLFGEEGTFCSAKPCLFDVLADPEERHDLADANPAIVETMQARVAELQKSEVSIEASGLCPFATGKRQDPKCSAKAKEVGFWMPWCDEGFKCVPAPVPTPPTPPTPGPAPTPETCSGAERAKAAMPMAIVRADLVVKSASAVVAGKQAWVMVMVNRGVGGNVSSYMLQLKGNSTLCLGIHGGTTKNPSHGQATLLTCSKTDATQQWLRKAKASGTFTLSQAKGCLDLQQGHYIMEQCQCSNNDANQLYTYDDATGHLSFASKNGKVVDVC
jgi:hypothetical protein